MEALKKEAVNVISKMPDTTEIDDINDLCPPVQRRT